MRRLRASRSISFIIPRETGLVQGSIAPSSSERGLVGDDLVLVEDGQVAEAVAVGAGALRAVEGKEVGERVLVGDPAGLAFELVGEGELPAVLGPDLDPAAAVLEARLRGNRPAARGRRSRGPGGRRRCRGSRLFGRRPLTSTDLAVADDPEKAEFLEAGQALLRRPGEGDQDFRSGGRAKSVSAMESIVSRATGRPHWRQWTTPIRAKRTRR